MAKRQSERQINVLKEIRMAETLPELDVINEIAIEKRYSNKKWYKTVFDKKEKELTKLVNEAKDILDDKQSTSMAREAAEEVLRQQTDAEFVPIVEGSTLRENEINRTALKNLSDNMKKLKEVETECKELGFPTMSKLVSGLRREGFSEDMIDSYCVVQLKTIEDMLKRKAVN